MNAIIAWLATALVQTTPPPEPIRILYVEDVPRWTYRYLRHTLRPAEGYRLQTWLLSAGSGSQAEGATPLERLPREHIDLFAYDVILLGDVTPEALGATDGERKAFQRDLWAFVRRGGGLGLITGARGMPGAYPGTPLGAWLPVEFDADAADAARPLSRIVVPDSGPLHPLLRVADDDAASRALWRRTPEFGSAPVEARNDATTVLHLGDDAGITRPLFVTTEIGQGRVLFVGSEELWRTRSTPGPEFHARVWANAVHWLAHRDPDAARAPRRSR